MLTFQRKLLITTLVVPVIIFFLGIPTLYTRFWSRHKQDACTNHFLYCALFFLFLTYNFSTRVIFEAFACADLGVDGQWLKSDIDTVCPAVDPNKFTVGWAIVCVFIYPVGVPCLLLFLLLHFGAPKIVGDKMKRSYLRATLDKYKMQNAVPLLIGKRLRKHLRRLKKEFGQRIEVVRALRIQRMQDDGLDVRAVVEEKDFALIVEDLRELLAGLHIEDSVPHSELQHVIDRSDSAFCHNVKSVLCKMDADASHVFCARWQVWVAGHDRVQRAREHGPAGSGDAERADRGRRPRRFDAGAAAEAMRGRPV